MCALPSPVTEAVYGLESLGSFIRTLELWSEFHHTGYVSRQTMLSEIYLPKYKSLVSNVGSKTYRFTDLTNDPDNFIYFF